MVRIKRRRAVGSSVAHGLFCAALAGGVYFSNIASVGLQDMSSLMAGMESGSQDGWMTHMTTAGAGAIQSAQAQFASDPIVTGTIKTHASGASIGAVNIAPSKAITPDTPDEDRIARTGKAGRIAAIVPVAPPKAFSAGSVLERQSFLLRPAIDDGVKMAFAQPQIKGEEYAIAAAFHVKQPEIVTNNVSPMIASLVTNNNPDILATAYAPPKANFAEESPFDTLLKNEGASSGRFVPPVPKNDHDWANDPLPPVVFTANEQKCLAIGIYFEARGEPKLGQAAVAQVILNRVRNPTFPNTICGVVYQNSHWRNRCQFSFTCDGIKDRVNSPSHWKLAQEIAMATTAGKIWLDDVGSSTHYHATYVNPRWAHSMKRVSKIGLHIFYRTYNGGWS